MKPYNRKRNLLKFSIVFLIVITGSIYFLFHSNAPRNLNVILISIDSLRSDHLGCYGYKRSTSPNIDQIAKDGVLFRQAIAQGSHTPPSVASILTSTLPRKHLMLNWGYILNPKLSTITKVLKSNNYKTMLIGMPIFPTGHDFVKDFDIYIEAKDTNFKKTTDKIIEFFEKPDHKPFFIWAHYMNTHYPYRLSEPYDRLFINDELYNKQRTLPIVKPMFAHYGVGGILDALAKEKKGITNPDYYIAQYDGAIRTVDDEIGRILKNLIKFELDKKTVIIITADHGEMLGEHNYYFSHGGFLYEPLIKVPLIIKCDKIILRNKIINTPVSAHLDIAPTILDILKIDKAKKMDGESLLGVILGKNNYSPYVFSENGIAAEEFIAIRNNEWKLIYNKGNNKEYELYNLKEDPGELNNLVSLEKDKFESLKQKLNEYKQTNFQGNIAKPILDEETKKRMKSLGYIQ